MLTMCQHCGVVVQSCGKCEASSLSAHLHGACSVVAVCSYGVLVVVW